MCSKAQRQSHSHSTAVHMVPCAQMSTNKYEKIHFTAACCSLSVSDVLGRVFLQPLTIYNKLPETCRSVKSLWKTLLPPRLLNCTVTFIPLCHTVSWLFQLLFYQFLFPLSVFNVVVFYSGNSFCLSFFSRLMSLLLTMPSLFLSCVHSTSSPAPG